MGSEKGRRTPDFSDSDINEVVELSAREFEQLGLKFGEHGRKDWIEKLYLWKKSSKRSKNVKSDYFTILNWARKDRTIEFYAAPEGSKLFAPGEDHEHRCPACYEQPHKWHCGGVDGDGYPCQMSQTVACHNYFKELDVKKRQGKLAL